MIEVLQSKIRPTTEAAAGVPRLRWTLDEFERMAELGFFTEEDHIELIGGELVPIAPKTVRHETLRSELFNRVLRRLPEDMIVAAALGWRLSEDTYLEPDFLVYPSACRATIPWLPAREVLLVIEVADLSLAYDTTLKARLYAGLGVPEYWVVDVVNPATCVYRGPTATGYAETTTVGANEPLASSLIPSLSVRLADLRLE